MPRVVREDGRELALRELAVTAVHRRDYVQPDIFAEPGDVVLLDVEVALRLRQREVKHPQHDGNGINPLSACTLNHHLALVEPGLRVLRHMRREKELLAASALERRALELRRVLEVLLHAEEGLVAAVVALIDLGRANLCGAPRRGDPEPADLAVLLRQARVVVLGLLVDTDEVLVIQQQFGTQPLADVLEVAVPAVAVLVPHLHDLEVEFLLRNDVAFLALQITDREGELAEVLRRIEDERAGLVLVARGNDGTRRTGHAVLGI